MIKTSVISDLIEVRDERWCWPIYDKESYHIQIADTTLYTRIEPFLKHKGVMVQAGGNCGVMLEQFALNFGVVYTFEPDPLNFYCLNVNLPYSNLIKFQACVGNNHKLVLLNNGFTSEIQDVGAVHINNHISTGDVPTLQIDDLNLDRCDLIQLDTEGFEYYGLLGALNTINKFHPVLCIEMNPHWARRYGVTLEMVENVVINQLGYKLKATHMEDRIYV
jgi:FkbM family methyltransferase